MKQKQVFNMPKKKSGPPLKLYIIYRVYAGSDVIQLCGRPLPFEWQETKMGKICCADRCTNRCKKGSGIKFYGFPENERRILRWIVAVARKDWKPNKYSWLCSAHFVSGCKSNDPLSPDCVPSVFAHVKSPAKRRAVEVMERLKEVLM